MVGMNLQNNRAETAKKSEKKPKQRTLVQLQSNTHLGVNTDTETDTLSWEKQPDMLQVASKTLSQKMHHGKIKMYEWISNTDLLVFLIIVVILVFLCVCLFIFYNAFYPDGIPQHLKEDSSSEDSRSNRGSRNGDNNMMADEAMGMMDN